MRFPSVPFIGVKGGYGTQFIPEVIPGNVTVYEPMQDMRSIYAQTKIVLMPSSYESWGRVAIEAAASGIPTIAADTPGLREALGATGYFLPATDIDAWSTAVEHLLGCEQAYAINSRDARARFEQLQVLHDAQYAEFQNILRGIVFHEPENALPRVNIVASMSHFLDHLLPIYHALPDTVSGSILVPQALLPYTRQCGVTAIPFVNDFDAIQKMQQLGGVWLSSAVMDLRRVNKAQLPSVFCEHGAGQTYSSNHPSYAGSTADREHVILFICPGQDSVNRYRRTLPGIPAVAVG
jgi:hypothetical protein